MSYYKEQIPSLIAKMKVAVEQCLDIIGQDIDSELSDDKLHSALKGKRMAAEDAKYYSKEIDALEDELAGREAETAPSNPVNKHKRTE